VRIVAFLNFKGGVGKTANVVNLGACLSLLHKKRVLVVDLDPQCNATYWLLRPGEFNQLADGTHPKNRVRQTTYQIFKDVINGTCLFDVNASIIRGVPRNEDGTEIIPLLHLLPGAFDLLEIEFSVPHRVASRFKPCLRNALSPISNDYDFVFLDCPPNLYHVSITAVLAAQNIVVPYNPDYLSLSGFRALCRHLRQLDDSLQASRAHFAQNLVSALTVNRYDKRGNVYDTAVAELQSQLDLLKEAQLVHPKCAVLSPSIRQDVRIAESTSEHKPVILYSPKSIGAVDYVKLSSSFLSQMDHLL